MASNPPFQVEDTDEDFFDKLVDDDVDFKLTPLSEPTNIANGNRSDVTKAFSNLVINDVGTLLVDSGKLGVVEHKQQQEEEQPKASSFSINGDIKHESTVTCIDPRSSSSHTLVSSNSFTFDCVTEEPNPAANGLEEPNHGSKGAPGVKEVQWTDFTTKPVESGIKGFGSYNDFFTEFGDSPPDQIGNGGKLVTSQQNDVDGSLHMENVNEYSHQFQSNGGQDQNSSQYWENLYPGWKYDANTGQWYQVNEGFDAAQNVQGAYYSNTTSEWTVSGQKTEASYLQQSLQPVVGAVAEKGTPESVTSWNSVSQANHTNESLSNWDQASQENSGYPSHMVFDPQHPGWYYDMNTQEWCSLDAYNSQSIVQAQDQVNQNGFSATNTYYGNDQRTYGGHDQLNKQSFSNVEQQGSTMCQPDAIAKSVPMSDFRGNQSIQNSHGTSFLVDNHANQHQSFHYGETASSFQRSGQVSNEFPAVSGAQSFVSIGNFNQSFSQSPGETINAPKTYGSPTHLSYSQQPVQNGQQVSYATHTAGRSSAGRSPHALVTFGFGGKLIVIKNTTALINQSYGSQDSNGGSIFVHNMAEAFTGGTNVSSSYFDTLCRKSFSGPLASGNVGGKELSKWIDERITHSESSNTDYRNSEVLKLLFSLLKIASQHYGKLRSPFGTDATSKENDAPEVDVARLFASVRKNTAGYSDYGHFTQCLQQLPSERETQVTAAEVQSLLVSGRKMEALQRAQDGQLWGPALVLSAQLGDQFYVDTVRKMALRQLVAGSPLRTLCLLIAGRPADAFSSETTTDGVIPGAVNMSQQVQPGANCMLEDWEENLAVITANRTKDDELVLIHLGDCLWKERSNIIAAHICYLVAEANIESYSDTARLCLIGADHWKYPRTYASPEAIQRTEVYEYAKLQENSWSTLLPFQPYKLIYAHMLAEVGRVSDSLKYCQSVSNSIKTGRASEVEVWRLMVTSLEDRIKFHQQSGFSAILAPAKIVGKLRNLFESTAHRVVGGLPPPVPSTAGGHTQNEHHYQATGPRGVLTSQSTMAMSSLVPSASLEPINQWSDDANRNIIHNKSVSEPDFSRSPKQVVPSKENSGGSQNESSGGTSRFRRFGFGSQLLQKTLGLVLKPRGGDKQAKLGDTNKFYYDKKLKRWVEEGADPPAEEAALAPPPTTMATFQNGPTPSSSSSSDYNLSALKSEGVSQTNGISEFSSPMSSSGGIPPIPPATSNQFSARGRLGVRARYVDTFNQGGGENPTNFFQSPPTPTIKPTTNPKFFVPTSSTSTSTEQPVESPSDSTQQPTSDGKENHSFTSAVNNSSFQSFPQPSSAMTRQKFSSMDNISEASGAGEFANHTMPPGTRRIASWNGNEQGFSFSNRRQEQKPESFMSSEVGLMHSPMISDDLQEVDL